LVGKLGKRGSICFVVVFLKWLKQEEGVWEWYVLPRGKSQLKTVFRERKESGIPTDRSIQSLEFVQREK
jgi:hypothetical protein